MPTARFRPVCTRTEFVALFTLINTLLFQWPLLRYAYTHLDGFGFGTIGSLLLLQAALTYVLLAVIATFSRRLLKFIAVILLVANACAIYFIQSYGVLLDRGMMGNVQATHWAELVELLHPRLALYVLGLGLLPAFLLWHLPIRLGGRPRLFATTGGLLLATVVWLYAASSSWLWIDQHAKHLGGLVLPWSYLANTARHLSQQSRESAPQTALPDGTLPPLMAQKEVVVLVIGEAARAANTSYYGYARETTPFTRSTTLQALPGARSCATYTTASVACILSHRGAEEGLPIQYEPLPTYLSRHGVDVIWRTNNSGEPRLNVNSYQRRSEIVAGCTEEACPHSQFDGGLLHGLETQIVGSDADRVFVVLHLTGSHGPAYNKKYPKEFERFTPVCESVQLEQCSFETLQNAYDNTLIYTDSVLAQLIDQLGKLPFPSAMLYVADHGESLGEYGLYLHGTPNAIAPDVQRDVPFYAWVSDAHPRLRMPVATPPDLSHDHVFHSIIGAFGMASPAYKSKNDLFGNAP